MTDADLSEYVDGIESDETGASDDPDEGGSNAFGQDRSYTHGRCRAITTEGRRCRSGCSEPTDDCCQTHNGPARTITIDDHPVDLIEQTSRTLWRNVEDLDVDHERITEALHARVGLEERPLPVYEDGVWLPWRFAAAKQLIIRVPRTTIVSNLHQTARPRIYPMVDLGDWGGATLRSGTIRNEECVPCDEHGQQIGLKVRGGDQHWFDVDPQRTESPDGEVVR